MTETAVYAAGGVVWRVVDDKLRVLLIHRTKYRDVTLPKGKVDPGEMLAETAVREIHEETGIRVALGVPVGVSRYRLPSKRIKIVHYWAGGGAGGARPPPPPPGAPRARGRRRPPGRYGAAPTTTPKPSARVNAPTRVLGSVTAPAIAEPRLGSVARLRPVASRARPGSCVEADSSGADDGGGGGDASVAGAGGSVAGAGAGSAGGAEPPPFPGVLL